jgi:hypothetical protein
MASDRQLNTKQNPLSRISDTSVEIANGKVPGLSTF